MGALRVQRFDAEKVMGGNDMTYFSNPSFDEEERRNIAFQSVIAIRESISMAKKSPQPITYEQALDLIHDLNPEIYKQVTTLLSNKNESDVVKYYKEKAEILSAAPTTLIDADIIEHENSRVRS